MSAHSPINRFDGLLVCDGIEYGALEIAPEGTWVSQQTKVDNDCCKLYKVVGKIYLELNNIAQDYVPHPAIGIMCQGLTPSLYLSSKRTYIYPQNCPQNNSLYLSFISVLKLIYSRPFFHNY